jgi:hypothetical protein
MFFMGTFKCFAKIGSAHCATAPYPTNKIRFPYSITVLPPSNSNSSPPRNVSEIKSADKSLVTARQQFSLQLETTRGASLVSSDGQLG